MLAHWTTVTAHKTSHAREFWDCDQDRPSATNNWNPTDVPSSVVDLMLAAPALPRPDAPTSGV